MKEIQALTGGYARDLLAWWYSTLLEFVPISLRRDSLSSGNVVVFGLEADGSLAVSQRRGNSECLLVRTGLTNADVPLLRQSLGRIPKIDTLFIRIPPGNILGRFVTLPLAAEAHLRSALTLQLGRLIPFPKEDVYWTFKTTTRDMDNLNITVRLLILPKASVQAVFDLLSTLGRQFVSLTAIAGDGVDTIDLLSAPSKEDSPSRIHRVLTWASAVSVGTAAIIPFAQQQFAIARCRSELASLGPKLQEAKDIRHRREVSLTTQEVIVREMLKTGDPLEALSSISQLLPDDTYLTQFAMRDRTVTLTGKSAAASHLIPILAHGAKILDPRFVAPVTKDAVDQLNLFSISLKLVS